MNAREQGPGQPPAQVGTELTAERASRQQVAGGDMRMLKNHTKCQHPPAQDGRTEVTQETQECDFNKKKGNAGKEKPQKAGKVKLPLES